MNRARRTPILVLLVLVVACHGADGPRLVTIPPPRDWSAELQKWRDSRDRYFGTAPDSPLPAVDRPDFRGLTYWPDEPRLYFVGAVDLYPTAESLTMITTTGEPRPCEKVGRLRFEYAGRELSLQVYRMEDSEPRPGTEAFFVPFMDATTGEESYPAGRYLDLDGRAGGPYVLDFNKAYNPFCAYGAMERFSCPKTPEENRLPVRIEAGERGYRGGPG